MDVKLLCRDAVRCATHPCDSRPIPCPQCAGWTTAQRAAALLRQTPTLNVKQNVRRP